MADTSCHPQLWRRTSHGVDALVPTELELLVETALHLGKAKINDATMGGTMISPTLIANLRKNMGEYIQKCERIHSENITNHLSNRAVEKGSMIRRWLYSTGIFHCQFTRCRHGTTVVLSLSPWDGQRDGQRRKHHKYRHVFNLRAAFLPVQLIAEHETILIQSFKDWHFTCRFISNQHHQVTEFVVARVTIFLASVVTVYWAKLGP